MEHRPTNAEPSNVLCQSIVSLNIINLKHRTQTLGAKPQTLNAKRWTLNANPPTSYPEADEKTDPKLQT